MKTTIDIKVIWDKIRKELKAGTTSSALAAKYNLSVQRINARKRAWDKEEYFKDSKYSKFHTPEYKAWRNAVLIRDKFKCVICDRGKPAVKALQADHIRSWARHPELRYDVSNGRTLCIRCHKKTLNYGRKGGTYVNDEQTDAEWVRKEREAWKLSSVKKKLQKKLKVGKVKK